MNVQTTLFVSYKSLNDGYKFRCSPNEGSSSIKYTVRIKANSFVKSVGISPFTFNYLVFPIWKFAFFSYSLIIYEFSSASPTYSFSSKYWSVSTRLDLHFSELVGDLRNFDWNWFSFKKSATIVAVNFENFILFCLLI